MAINIGDRVVVRVDQTHEMLFGKERVNRKDWKTVAVPAGSTGTVGSTGPLSSKRRWVGVNLDDKSVIGFEVTLVDDEVEVIEPRLQVGERVVVLNDWTHRQVYGNSYTYAEQKLAEVLVPAGSTGTVAEIFQDGKVVGISLDDSPDVKLFIRLLVSPCDVWREC